MSYLRKQQLCPKKAQLVSYEVAGIIALEPKSQVLAESAILPAYKGMVKIMVGGKAEQDISKIPLSHNTIQRRILYLSDNTEETVVSKIVSLLFKSMNPLT